jgi:hypothetical protein
MKLRRLTVCGEPRSRVIQDLVEEVSALAVQRVVKLLSVALVAAEPVSVELAVALATASESLPVRMSRVGRLVGVPSSPLAKAVGRLASGVWRKMRRVISGFALAAMKSRRAALVNSTRVLPDATDGVKVPSEVRPAGFRLPGIEVVALVAVLNVSWDSLKDSLAWPSGRPKTSKVKGVDPLPGYSLMVMWRLALSTTE